MANRIFPSTSFTIPLPSVNLADGEIVYFKFVLKSSTTNNFTASLSQGSAILSSLAPSTGYSNITKDYLYTGSAFVTSSNINEIIFETNISNLFGSNYIFVPNPTLVGAVSSSLYPEYGDVDYPFFITSFDVFLIYLSDGTYIEYRILRAYMDGSGRLRLVLDQQLSQAIKNDISGIGGSGNEFYKKFLILSRRKDETNITLTFTKRDGKTSYGLIIPDNIDPEILKNIDVITKEIKTKILTTGV
jgi:hypothetical protein